MQEIVFATNNAHKLDEIRRIVGDGIQIRSLAEIGCHEDIPETADTLEGNALQKARYVKEHYGYDCFADDTGLMVDALGGAPGVYSARYAGPNHDSVANMKLLLENLKGITDRKARFVTVIALLADGEEHTFTGCVEGEILTAPDGDGGFGYDPVFRPEGEAVSFARMSPEAKNAISHRGRATALLTRYLTQIKKTQ
ncbi:MAG: non-canonical purine NTP diphosphatase [Muribaculaceae bacterium]|nr:non-canonical purine NTP diphosphatase [Muribaculaceae bacterium]